MSGKIWIPNISTVILLMCGIWASIPFRPIRSNELFYLYGILQFMYYGFRHDLLNRILVIQCGIWSSIPCRLTSDVLMTSSIYIVWISLRPIEPYYICFIFTGGAEFGRVFPVDLHRYVPVICFNYVIWISL